MTIAFNSADDVTVTAPTLVDNQETLIWESAEITNGSNLQHIKLNISYHDINPGPDVGSNALVAILVQEQDDGSFEEIGRQNTPIAKLEQGAKREIIVTSSTDKEEGIDDVIPGFQGIPVRLKSFFDDEASGTLKVCIHALSTDVATNPLVSVRFSVNGARFDV
jgi:hypothetical protein